MKPIVKLDRTLVAVETDQTVHVMLELAAPPAPEVTERRPIDVVAVIDRSGSMSGEPLEAVLRATSQLAQLLGTDDRLAVVTFDDTVDLVGARSRSAENRSDGTSFGRSGVSLNLSRWPPPPGSLPRPSTSNAAVPATS